LTLRNLKICHPDKSGQAPENEKKRVKREKQKKVKRYKAPMFRKRFKRKRRDYLYVIVEKLD
jgi:hypothetical protein